MSFLADIGADAQDLEIRRDEKERRRVPPRPSGLLRYPRDHHAIDRRNNIRFGEVDPRRVQRRLALNGVVSSSRFLRASARSYVRRGASASLDRFFATAG